MPGDETLEIHTETQESVSREQFLANARLVLNQAIDMDDIETANSMQAIIEVATGKTVKIDPNEPVTLQARETVNLIKGSNTSFTLVRKPGGELVKIYFSGQNPYRTNSDAEHEK